MYQNGTGELAFGNHALRAKTGTLLSRCADNHGKLFAPKSISYKWQHGRI
jgi:hypothetical protein